MSLNSTTVKFLSDLSKNNNREWFADNKAIYADAYDDFKALVAEVAEKLTTLDGPIESKIFRIYRDVRFSKDKSPYKTNFAASYSRDGKYRRGGFYLHIDATKAMIGGGFWQPNAQDLKYIREGIIRHEEEYRKLIASDDVANYFSGVEGSALKTAPRGFDKNHTAVDLIRQKQFILSKEFDIKQVTKKSFSTEIADGYSRLLPYFAFMSEVLVYDANGEER